MIGNNIVIPHSWQLVNESFVIGIKPDISIHQNIMILLLLSVPTFTIPMDCMLIYLLFFSSKKSKYTNIFYKLILAFTLVVLYWSWYFFYQGLCQLFGQSVFGELGNIIIASTAQYLFYVCMNMNLLLAFNRFSAVVYGHKHEIIFSTFNGFLYIAIIYCGSAIMNIPSFMFLIKYYPELGTFNYLRMPSKEFLKISIFVEMGAVYAVHLGIFVLYGWSFFTYRKMKSLSVQHKKERRLLIQAIISGSPCFVLMTCHHLIHFPLLEVLAGELCVGIDPVVYMWFNKEIRADFLEITGLKKYLSRFNLYSVHPTSTNAPSNPTNTPSAPIISTNAPSVLDNNNDTSGTFCRPAPRQLVLDHP